MKGKNILLIVIGVILLVLLGSSVYINFIANTGDNISYIVLADLIIGILGSISVILLGNKYLTNKKDHQVMFVGFLLLVFTLAISILNVVHGYNSVLEAGNYQKYMVYVSTITNIYIYLFFTLIIGIINLNLFIKNKSN